MSGLKNNALSQFYRLLHARGETTTTLAAKLYSNRAHVTLVIAGGRRKGRTWERLQQVLTPAEIALIANLKGKTVFTKLAEARSRITELEAEICKLQQCSPWNEKKDVA